MQKRPNDCFEIRATQFGRELAGDVEAKLKVLDKRLKQVISSHDIAAVKRAVTRLHNAL